MKVAIYLFVIILSLSVTQTNAVDNKVKRHSLTRLSIMEKNGVQAYQRGQYQKAFEKVQMTARMGFKESQYVLAFMFLKGQYVEQSLILGMAWLGVAKESKIDSWHQLFEQIYAKATSSQKRQIDLHVKEYIDKFGVKTQNIRCVKRAPVGMKRVRSFCEVLPGKTSPLYDLELDYQEKF